MEEILRYFAALRKIDAIQLFIYVMELMVLKLGEFANVIMKIKQLVVLIDLHKESSLKASQYLAIFLAWFQQRNKSPHFNFYFAIYQKIFHSRKLFRLFKTLFYIPQIVDISKSLKQHFTFFKMFELLAKIFNSLFYALDNLTIISMIMGVPYYKTVRRISHTILLLGIIFSAIALFIQLRKSFKEESDLKNLLEKMTPTELLEKLAEIDQFRRHIAIKLIKTFGDLFPTLARTNLPEIVIKTKINKGTVGFFGMISAVLQIYLKTKEYYGHYPYQ